MHLIQAQKHKYKTLSIVEFIPLGLLIVYMHLKCFSYHLLLTSIKSSGKKMCDQAFKPETFMHFKFHNTV